MDNELMLFESRSKIVVGSRIIASRFGKEHSSVLKSIDGVNRKDVNGKYRHINGLMDDLKQSGVNTLDYFIKTKYTDDRNREQPEYFMTRDGFTLLVMGFTGSEALKWKLKYMEAFNKMEDALRERQTTDWLQTRERGKLIRRDETDAIQLLIPYAEEQGSKNAKRFYVNYSKMVNKAVGLESGQREAAPYKTLMLVALMEDIISNTIIEEMEKGVYYKEIYKKCKTKIQSFVSLAYLRVS